MNRRNFLGLMVGGVATAAAVRTFPFRVFSFPKQVELYDCYPDVDPAWLTALRYEQVYSTSGTFMGIPRYLGSMNPRERKAEIQRIADLCGHQLVPDVPHNDAFHPASLRHFLADPSSSFSAGE